MKCESEHYGYQVSWSDKEQMYIATCAELPGTAAGGDSAEAALREIKIAVKAGVELLIERGHRVPRPLANFSGNLSLRVTPHMHRMLTLQAQQQRVSLNRLIAAKLAG